MQVDAEVVGCAGGEIEIGRAQWCEGRNRGENQHPLLIHRQTWVGAFTWLQMIQFSCPDSLRFISCTTMLECRDPRFPFGKYDQCTLEYMFAAVLQ